LCACSGARPRSKASWAKARHSHSPFRCSPTRRRCTERATIPMSVILIIEDNDKNLKLVRDVLQVKGYTTLEAVTAEKGIKLAGEHKPDLILMDIQLPGMNGIDALRVLRADSATSAIPAIAVTASVMQQDRNLITDAGFDGYVGKPINLKEFLDAVRDVLAKNSR